MAESEDHDPVPDKRMKIEATSTELLDGSNTGAAEENRHRKIATATVGESASSGTMSTPPVPARYPPFRKYPDGKAAWELMISKLPKRDPRRNLPTMMQPKDPQTARSVTSSRHKAMVRDVARSVVTIISTSIGGDIRGHFAGFVISLNESRKCARIFTSSETISGSDPKPKLHVLLPNRTVLEGQLLFFNAHYDIALLEISSESDLPLRLPSFGSNPDYGQEVFVLARDTESYLMVRQGRIEWLEKTDYLGRHCHMFLSCRPPVYGNGGPVIDLDGNVTGIVFENYSSSPPPILTISTILACMEMWMKFSRIAHPIHGLRLSTVELLEVSLQDALSLDHNINCGYIVDEVSVGSTAERLGIKSGEVIVSFDGLHDHTLPQLEDFLLSLGWRYLQRSTDSSSTVDVKLEVYDLLGRRARTITLPVGFSDASETLHQEWLVEEEEDEEEEEDDDDEEASAPCCCVHH